MTSLLIPWEALDERAVHAALQQLEPNLFLNKEIDRYGRLFYTACLFNGDRAPDPITVVVDWRETDDTPKPLSQGLVYEIEKMMRAGGVSVEAIMRRNNEMRVKKDDERQQQAEDIAKDFERHKNTGFAIVPRSQGLRMSRDRMRRRGHKV